MAKIKESVSIIIPAYNEGSRIARTLADMDAYLLENCQNYEIIVVDDGSTDRTVEVIDGFGKTSNRVRLIKNGVNRGKGHSVKRGVLASSNELVVFSDADE